MRRSAAAVGLRAPSLYKHFPDKAAVEVALVVQGFNEVPATFEQAYAGQEASLTTFMTTDHTFARAHPDLYRLMTKGTLPPESMRAGIEARTAAPLQAATSDRFGAGGLRLRPWHDAAGTRRAVARGRRCARDVASWHCRPGCDAARLAMAPAASETAPSQFQEPVSQIRCSSEDLRSCDTYGGAWWGGVRGVRPYRVRRSASRVSQRGVIEAA